MNVKAQRLNPRGVSYGLCCKVYIVSYLGWVHDVVSNGEER